MQYIMGAHDNYVKKPGKEPEQPEPERQHEPKRQPTLDALER